MLRQLPETITADETPEWLPVGWIVHSTVLKRGRQTKTYTHLRTGMKFYTKDRVLEFNKMDEIREHRESAVPRKKKSVKAIQDEETAIREEPSWLQIAEMRSVSFCINPFHTINDNMSTGVLQCQAASPEKIEETGSDYITYDYNTDEEDWSDNEYVEDKGSQENVENLSNNNSTPLRLQPERMTKLESRAIMQCLLEDESMSFENEENIQEVETSKETRVVVDTAEEITGLTGSFSIEINLNCEPLGDSLVEKDLNQSGKGVGTRNFEIREQESALMHTSEEPLNTQAANEWRRSISFPNREVFENAKARSSAVDLINTIEFGLKPPQEKRKKSAQPCSSKKKDNETQTDKLQKGKKTPRKPQRGKGSPVEWPEPCPYFPFEPLANSVRIEDDDSVIRSYLEQHFTAAGSADGNLPLPDFGLPSFSNIRVSQNEEPEFKKKKSPDDPPCVVQVASSSLPCYLPMVDKQTVAGN